MRRLYVSAALAAILLVAAAGSWAASKAPADPQHGPTVSIEELMSSVKDLPPLVIEDLI